MNSLPADFDGTFKFTNFTKEEFRTRWGGIEYTFPAEKTIPLIIPSATPEEVQNIRKKFARDLAVIEFYKSEKFKMMDAHVPGGVPALYTDNDLAPFIKRCLEPLPLAKAVMTPIPKDSDDKFRTDRKGKKVTKILEEGESLISQGSGAIE